MRCGAALYRWKRPTGSEIACAEFRMQPCRKSLHFRKPLLDGNVVPADGISCVTNKISVLADNMGWDTCYDL